MSEPVSDREPDRMGRAMGVCALMVLLGCGGSAAVFWTASRYMREHHLGFWWMPAAALAYGAAVVAITYLAARTARRIAGQPCSAAARRYQRRVTACASVYVLTLVAAIAAYKRLQLAGPGAYAVAAAPALPVIAMIVMIGLYIREEKDEFQRAIQVEAALWATGGLLAFASLWGFLEMFDLAPHAPAWAAFPFWAVMLSFGQLVARRRYR